MKFFNWQLFLKLMMLKQHQFRGLWNVDYPKYAKCYGKK